MVVGSAFVTIASIVVSGRQPFLSCGTHALGSIQQVRCSDALRFSGFHCSLDRFFNGSVYTVDVSDAENNLFEFTVT